MTHCKVFKCFSLLLHRQKYFRNIYGRLLRGKLKVIGQDVHQSVFTLFCL